MSDDASTAAIAFVAGAFVGAATVVIVARARLPGVVGRVIPQEIAAEFDKIQREIPLVAPVRPVLQGFVTQFAVRTVNRVIRESLPF